MPRIADVLERESRTVDLEQGDFERLLGRRERKQRNRRIRAGALGVIVALAMGLVLVRSLTSDPIPADPPVEPTAGAGGGGHPRVRTRRRHLRRRPGRLERGQDRGRSSRRRGLRRPSDGRTTGRRDRCGRRTAGTSPFATGTVPNPELGGGVISDAEGNVVATFPREGWEIAWSPDSTRVAVWDVTFETIGVYGLDGARQAQLTMPPGWTPSGDHDPKWMPDGTSVWVEDWELPLDGSAPRELPSRGGDPYATYSPDGSLVAYSTNGSLTVARSDGSEPREVFDEGRMGPTGATRGPRPAIGSRSRRAAAAVHGGPPNCASSMWQPAR